MVVDSPALTQRGQLVSQAGRTFKTGIGVRHAAWAPQWVLRQHIDLTSFSFSCCIRVAPSAPRDWDDRDQTGCERSPRPPATASASMTNAANIEPVLTRGNARSRTARARIGVPALRMNARRTAILTRPNRFRDAGCPNPAEIGVVNHSDCVRACGVSYE